MNLCLETEGAHKVAVLKFL